MLMMYYTTVSGWMTSYFYKFATGEFKTGMDSKSVSNVFNNLTSSPIEMLIWIFIITALGFFVCSKGVQKGLEKVSKFMMVAFIVLLCQVQKKVLAFI